LETPDLRGHNQVKTRSKFTFPFYCKATFNPEGQSFGCGFIWNKRKDANGDKSVNQQIFNTVHE